MVPDCKYRLPCGRCDKFNKNCDVLLEHMKKEGLSISESDIAKKVTNHDYCDSATSISSKPGRCGDCELGVASLSTPDIIKCSITKIYQDSNHICDVEKVEVYG